MGESRRRPQASPGRSSQNRFLLVAALALVTVIAAFILWANMEPPPETAGNRSNTGEMSPEQMRTDLMTQIAHVREMVGEDTTNFEALATLGNLYFDAGMPEESITWYKKALRIQPENLSVLTDMSTMYRSLREYDTAISILRNVVTMDSTWEQAWFNLGVIQSFDLKDYPAALEAWRRFLALTPNSEHAVSVREEIERLQKELGVETPGT